MNSDPDELIEAWKRRQRLNRAFVATWRRLAKLGACDALDGGEFMRVFFEWTGAGRPLNVVTFIRQAANRLSGP